MAGVVFGTNYKDALRGETFDSLRYLAAASETNGPNVSLFYLLACVSQPSARPCFYYFRFPSDEFLRPPQSQRRRQRHRLPHLLLRVRSFFLLLLFNRFFYYYYEISVPK